MNGIYDKQGSYKDGSPSGFIQIPTEKSVS